MSSSTRVSSNGYLETRNSEGLRSKVMSDFQRAILKSRVPLSLAVSVMGDYTYSRAPVNGELSPAAENKIHEELEHFLPLIFEKHWLIGGREGCVYRSTCCPVSQRGKGSVQLIPVKFRNSALVFPCVPLPSCFPQRHSLGRFHVRSSMSELDINKAESSKRVLSESDDPHSKRQKDMKSDNQKPKPSKDPNYR